MPYYEKDELGFPIGKSKSPDQPKQAQPKPAQKQKQPAFDPNERNNIRNNLKRRKAILDAL